jgi:pimeloyl-ACP methyl ester carboxylesterase
MPANAPAWLTDEELAVYAQAFRRTGFQGGLNWYRAATNPAPAPKIERNTIDIPSIYIAGAADWGIYQKPGELERMQRDVCTDFRGVHLVEGAGHWLQQEQPERVAALLLDFLSTIPPRAAHPKSLP